ncbi:MAG: hypothetical protein P857_943 [Candidatus Xenolissoclinum pacificiensis L6]|uniref:Uncharacterized protein n=1 Tax=Candidatus Xenolissoclinum pacificiensis L6 TaxID=1401685 RepID=W2V2V7_9RICK|nr:MAG: hypothetical protein P857_943 [Candidatus Xenolissoclinum pacificiensis L6]
MYRDLYKEYHYKTINHGIDECVNQDPNTTEGSFSHLERMIVGIYHSQ